MAKNQYPRRRVTREQFPNGITSKPFNSKPSRADGRDEYIPIFVEDDLRPATKAEYSKGFTDGLYNFLHSEIAKLTELQEAGTITHKDECLLHSLWQLWDRYFGCNPNDEFHSIEFRGREVK